MLWMACCAVAFAGFIALGNWQVRRLGWKLKLIHDVDARGACGAGACARTCANGLASQPATCNTCT